MSFTEIWHQLYAGLLATTWLEFIAVIFGILSVLFSRTENIWVYPTGLINTTVYIYLSMVAGLYAEASVNLYYTVMSVVGWVLWAQPRSKRPLAISGSTPLEWRIALIFFVVCWLLLWSILSRCTNSSVPLADAFAAASAYTGMWLMTRKKIENWFWWMVTNAACVPLYFFKGYVFTSFQYLVFLVLAVMGYRTWKGRLSLSGVYSLGKP
jgi:nicotinamide mononucleotide transporter